MRRADAEDLAPILLLEVNDGLLDDEEAAMDPSHEILADLTVRDWLESAGKMVVGP